MIAQLSKRIASFFVHSKVIESENEQVYEYGLELLISSLLNSVIALVLALFSRTLWQCICFLVVFIFLRKSAGGFHAKTHLGCCSILAAVLGIFIVLIKFVHIEEYPIVSLAAVVFSIIMILRFAPLEHENKPITEKGKTRLRKNSIVLALISSVSVMVLFILDFRLIMVCVSFGMLTASGSMLAAVIEKKSKEMHLGTQK